VTLAWSGSLLYLGLAEGALLLVALVLGHTPSLRDQAVGCLAAVSAVVPFVLARGELAPEALFSPESAPEPGWRVGELQHPRVVIVAIEMLTLLLRVRFHPRHPLV
jgi:hypothetical protein